MMQSMRLILILITILHLMIIEKISKRNIFDNIVIVTIWVMIISVGIIGVLEIYIESLTKIRELMVFYYNRLSLVIILLLPVRLIHALAVSYLEKRKFNKMLEDSSPEDR